MINNVYLDNKDFIKDLDSFLLGGYSYPTVEEIKEDIDIEGSPFGTLTYSTGSYKDLSFKLDFVMINLENYNDKIEIIENFINDISDNRLYFKDKLNKCLRVKRIYSDGYTRKDNINLKYTLNFVCEPFWYDTILDDIELSNNGTFISETTIPYEVLGEVTCNGDTRIFINDELLQFNYNGKATIDCERGYVYGSDRVPIKTTGNTRLMINKGLNKFTSDTGSAITLKLKNRYRR